MLDLKGVQKKGCWRRQLGFRSWSLRNVILPPTQYLAAGWGQCGSAGTGLEWTLHSRRLAKQGTPEHKAWAALLESFVPRRCCYRHLPATDSPSEKLCSYHWALTSRLPKTFSPWSVCWRSQTKDFALISFPYLGFSTNPKSYAVAPQDLVLSYSFLSAQTIVQVHQEKPEHPHLVLYLRNWVLSSVSKREVLSSTVGQQDALMVHVDEHL